MLSPLFPSPTVFFSSLARSKYLSLFSLSLMFTLWQNPLFSMLIIIRSGLRVGIWWSLCIAKSQRILCVPFSGRDSGLYMYYLVLLLLWLLLLSLFFFFFFRSFSHQYYLMVFHWSLSDSKSLQVSRTRLTILAVLSNAVVWIVSTRPLTSKSSRPFNNPLVTVPNAPITIGTIVLLLFIYLFIEWNFNRKF